MNRLSDDKNRKISENYAKGFDIKGEMKETAAQFPHR